MPTISQNRIELNVMGLPAHDSTQMKTVNAATKIPAKRVRRPSELSFFRSRVAVAVMEPPTPCTLRIEHDRPPGTHFGAGRPHHATY
jgi:hypothetical protein